MLKKHWGPVENLPEYSSTVIEETAQVQRLKADITCFSDVSKSLFSKALWEESSSDRVDIVFDIYRQASVENTERLNQGSLTALSFRANEPCHTIKQWRNFLCNPNNKAQ